MRVVSRRRAAGGRRQRERRQAVWRTDQQAARGRHWHRCRVGHEILAVLRGQEAHAGAGQAGPVIGARAIEFVQPALRQSENTGRVGIELGPEGQETAPEVLVTRRRHVERVAGGTGNIPEAELPQRKLHGCMVLRVKRWIECGAEQRRHQRLAVVTEQVIVEGVGHRRVFAGRDGLCDLDAERDELLIGCAAGARGTLLQVEGAGCGADVALSDRVRHVDLPRHRFDAGAVIADVGALLQYVECGGEPDCGHDCQDKRRRDGAPGVNGEHFPILLQRWTRQGSDNLVKAHVRSSGPSGTRFLRTRSYYHPNLLRRDLIQDGWLIR